MGRYPVGTTIEILRVIVPGSKFKEREETSDVIIHMHKSPSQMVVDFTAMGVFHGSLFHWIMTGNGREIGVRV